MTRVLVVDDDPGLRQSLGLLLGESGYTMTTEGDPERALARARSGGGNSAEQGTL